MNFNFFEKNLPTAAALSLPYTNFLPSAPAQKCCLISPLRQKMKNFLKSKMAKMSHPERSEAERRCRRHRSGAEA